MSVLIAISILSIMWFVCGFVAGIQFALSFVTPPDGGKES